MWSAKTGEQIVCFYHADKPVFTLDCQYLLYIDSGRTLITYSLSRMAPMRYLACEADQLLVLPVKHRLVLTTRWMSSVSAPAVSLWDFHDGRQLVSLTDVALGGVRDISKDGAVAVDANLQVFDLDTGALKSSIDHNLDADFSFVRLTDDGRYVVWVDKLSVKVGRACDGALVAHACTHERPTSLCTLDSGYVLVVGREDGRILMMKLLPPEQSDDVGLSRPPNNAQERCSVIHGRQMCSDKLKASLDVSYQGSAYSVKDAELQRTSDSIRSVLAQRAKAPLLSTAMSKAVDTADKFLRSYSQLTPISDLHDGNTPHRFHSTVTMLHVEK